MDKSINAIYYQTDCRPFVVGTPIQNHKSDNPDLGTKPPNPHRMVDGYRQDWEIVSCVIGGNSFGQIKRAVCEEIDDEWDECLMRSMRHRHMGGPPPVLNLRQQCEGEVYWRVGLKNGIFHEGPSYLYDLGPSPYGDRP